MPTHEALEKLRELALSQFHEDREGIALELFSRYLTHAPDDYSARSLYADCLRSVGRYEDAEYELRLVQYAPVESPYYKLHARFGMLYSDWGKLQSAEEHWEKVCGAQNAPGWTWIMRGVNLRKMGRVEFAIECLTKATTIKIECDRDEAFLHLGYIYRMQGRYLQAADAFRRALELSPEYPQAIEGLNSVDGIELSLKEADLLLAE